MLALIEEIGGTFPTQGYGRFEDGRGFFLHYRHGCLSFYPWDRTRTKWACGDDSGIDFDHPIFQYEPVPEGFDSENFIEHISAMTKGQISGVLVPTTI
jgi:hypothetical protein